MKLIQILLEKEEAMTGTNCSNCMYTEKNEPQKIEEGDLDPQGGTIPKTSEELKRAKISDLLTLPGKEKVTVKKLCNHPKIQMDVTEHMCLCLLGCTRNN